MQVCIEKWATVETDTDSEEDAILQAKAMDAEGAVEYERAVTLDGCGSPFSKMEVALRKIATIQCEDKGENPPLRAAINLAKAALPSCMVGPNV